MRGEYRHPVDKTTGPLHVQFDTWRQQQWELHTHGGFITYPHHDAAGLCTYTYARSGAKIWCFIRPDLSKYKDRNSLFLDLDNFGYPEEFSKVTPVGTILLEPGSVL